RPARAADAPPAAETLTAPLSRRSRSRASRALEQALRASGAGVAGPALNFWRGGSTFRLEGGPDESVEAGRETGADTGESAGLLGRPWIRLGRRVHVRVL